jgi:hypothetical protein
LLHIVKEDLFMVNCSFELDVLMGDDCVSELDGNVSVVPRADDHTVIVVGKLEGF